jgi:hypothetical protein
MKTLVAAVFGSLLFLSVTSLATMTAQTTQPSASDQRPSQAGTSGLLGAVLLKSVDVAKSKAGEEIQAKTTREFTQGDLVIPKNSRLVGHVIQAKPRMGEAESELDFVFDRAVLKDKREVPLHAVIYQLSVPVEATQASAMAAGPSTSTLPQGGGVGGAAGSAAVAAPTLSHTLGATPNADTAAPGAAPTETKPGLFGFPKYALHMQTLPDGTERSFITSKIANIKVEAGTQLVLHVLKR